MKRILLATTLAIAGLSPAIVSSSAWAQGLSTSSIPSPGVGLAKPKNGVPREPAPPALPGARAEPTAIAPIAKSSADLPPTEALFDAINRGDLPVVKDAVNRGADLTGTNVLGLTPIELAVDLGRNQISFYLLSLRGGIAGSSPQGAPDDTPPKPPSRAERLAAAKAERDERAGRARTVSAAPAAPTTARLFVGGGGAPIPQAGFLGFDAGR